MAENDNLMKLRELVKTLETEVDDAVYDETLKKIESIIKEERSVIGGLKKDASKLRHYESICASILSVISATKL